MSEAPTSKSVSIRELMQRTDSKGQKYSYVNHATLDRWADEVEHLAGLLEKDTIRTREHNILVQENRRLSAALKEISELAVTGPSPLGSLHGAGIATGFSVSQEIALKALRGEPSTPEPSRSVQRRMAVQRGETAPEFGNEIAASCPECGAAYPVHLSTCLLSPSNRSAGEQQK